MRTFIEKPLRSENKQKPEKDFAHFDLALKETGIDGRFVTKNPGFKIDEMREYIITYEVKH